MFSALSQCQLLHPDPEEDSEEEEERGLLIASLRCIFTFSISSPRPIDYIGCGIASKNFSLCLI